jgi:hypothetical protein
MVRRLIFWIFGLGLPLLIAAGIFFFDYEYTSVLKLASGEIDIQLLDTTLIHPYFYFDSQIRLDVNLVIDHLSDTLSFQKLEVAVTSEGNSTQKIELTHVLAYRDTVNWEDVNSSYISSLTFAALPAHYKAMNPKRDFNSFRFFFETDNVNHSDRYALSITGEALYEGRIIRFNKIIHATRVMRFRRVQWMT